MAADQIEAALIETVDHLRKALVLLDGLGTHQVIAAEVSLALEHLREDVRLLRRDAEQIAAELPPHALG